MGIVINTPQTKTFIITFKGSGNLSDLTKNNIINKEGTTVKASNNILISTISIFILD